MVLRLTSLLFLQALIGLNNPIQSQHMASSNQKTYAFRLKPHDDLKKGIMAFAAEHKIKAGCMVTAVGSLEYVNLRFANQAAASGYLGHFEIVSLVGTFSDTYSHLHLSVSDSLGNTIGGHLLEGNKVYTTAEIVILDSVDLEFAREKDKTYGYDELMILPKPRQ
jgi:predicted DNA-binding protein with PD1-like motif